MPYVRAPFVRCGESMRNDHVVAKKTMAHPLCLSPTYNAPGTWNLPAAHNEFDEWQDMVGAIEGEMPQSHCPQSQPHYPQAKHLPTPPGLRRNSGQAELNAWSGFQNLSSFKGFEQPILYMVEGVGFETLTKRMPKSSVPDSLVRRSTTCGSSPIMNNSSNSNSCPDASCECVWKKHEPVAPNGEFCGQIRTQENDASYTNPIEDSSWAGVVTVMVCNLPRRVTQERLADITNELGFCGLYDLVYIPKGAKVSVGYGFVNFIKPGTAQAFRAAFDGFRFPEFNSSKRAFTQVANTQGLTATLDSIRRGGNFRNRCVFPLLFNNGSDAADGDFALGPAGAFL